MESKQAIKKIRVLLGMEAPGVPAEAPVETPVQVELKESVLKDGTRIQYDALEAGSPVYTVTPDGNVPAPAGTYVFEDGTEITVVTDGLIDTVKAVPEDQVITAEPTEPVEAAEEPAMPEEPATESPAEVEEEDLMVLINDLQNVVTAQQERIVAIESVLAELTTGFGAFRGDVKKLTEKVSEIATSPSEVPVFASKHEAPKAEPTNTNGRLSNIDSLKQLK